MMEQRTIYAGVMSGTSVDAIDVVLARFDADRPVLLGAVSHPWPASLRGEILQVAAGCDRELDRSGHLDRAIARETAVAVQQALTQAGCRPDDVAAIGFHGQTVRHRPDGPLGFTWQIGDPGTLAELTGIDVIADFRRRDVAAGGQGAPLVPAFHAACMADAQRAVVVLNLGGIANITMLVPGEPVRGHDTGPANMLMDGWHQRHRGGACDLNGAWAAAHVADRRLLDTLLLHPYLSQPAPKSTGRETFGMAWLDRVLSGLPDQPDSGTVQATLLAFTVESVRREVLAVAAGGILKVCGGGSRNGALMQALTRALPSWQVEDTGRSGLDPLWVEATAFAWLARQHVLGLPGNLPAVTGAAGPRVLGARWPA